jgi:hypothetical protein
VTDDIDYAMFDGDCELISVFPTASLAEAVQIKLQYQADHQAKRLRLSSTFAKRSRNERRWMKRHTTGFHHGSRCATCL